MAKSFEEMDVDEQQNTVEYLAHYKKENIDNETFDPENEHLYWRPIANNLEPLSKHLKWILKEEGILDGDNNHLTVRDIGFFKGLKAAGIKDADKIIDAIQKYGYIELFEQ